ncbi:hypothetical protein ARAM_007127 [Aspergillus rambellii]|uniref:PH domain-containing protein n=1 Tax=Aspergillus rambellii TaxID=308745 RepID=A0A0F8XS61_9EURO|nr:hypothetical protein ARAM_007127 [Aspergillus rambellii]
MPRKMLAGFLRASAGCPQQAISTSVRCNASISRVFHSQTVKAAIAHPITAHGPPPKAPSAAPGFGEQQADGAEGTESQSRLVKRPTVLKKRFWKDVHVKQKPEGEYQVLLDKRPVRTPAKTVLSVPTTKPHLAHAIALEWDVMTSAQQALKNHLIPLTSLTARAADIVQEDAAGEHTTREQIIKTAMRYLDTDTLLCWVPENGNAAEEIDENGQKRETLREAQMRVAQDVIAFLSTKVWPGIEIQPVLDTDSIFPASQPQATKEIIRQWIEGLEAHDLAALERGILASKSLLVAVRLITEWSENFRHVQRSGKKKFGIEEAAEASTSSSRHHKRSKSALALAILHRDKSRDRHEETAGRDCGSPVESATSSPVNTSTLSISAISLHRGPSIRRSRHEANSPTMPTESISDPIASSQSGDNIEKLPSLSQGESGSMSLDQSVRTFRLFEILRSGDTTAISKAIKESRDPQAANGLSGTTIVHLAIQCAEPQVVEYVLSAGEDLDINTRDRDGNTPLHLAAQLGRGPVVRELLNRPSVNDSIVNYRGQTALEVARNPEIFQQLQLARSLFIDSKTQEIQTLIAHGDYDTLEKLLVEPRVEGIMDVNALDLVTDPTTAHSGGTLLHEGARKKDTKLIQILLMHGADPFRRDKKGKLPQDVTKDDRTRAIVKKSPAAVIAQRGIQEKAILGTSSGQGVTGRPGAGEASFAGKDSREMRGYLKKWTNYTSGYKLRWFVLEDGVLSYYKHQDDAGSACRGAINMKIARLNMDSQDKTRFEIHGKSSVKYHLKANHVVEAKRWFWTLNNAIQFAKDEAKEEERRQSKHAEVLRQAKIEQIEGRPSEAPSESPSHTTSKSNGKGLAPFALGVPSSSGAKLSTYTSRTTLDSVPVDEDGSLYGSFEQGPSDEMNRISSHVTTGPDMEGDEDDYGDYVSSRDMPVADKDAMNITAQSAKLQLEILANVASSLQVEKTRDPSVALSDPAVDQALTAYEAAVNSLKGLVQNLLKISRDRDAYWQHRLTREAYLRKMWEESMARIAQEHEELQSKMGESEEKRRRTKRALKEALENSSSAPSRIPSKVASGAQVSGEADVDVEGDLTAEQLQAAEDPKEQESASQLRRTKSALSQINSLYDSESDDGEDDEFFDAIDSGEIEVEDLTPAETAEEEEKVQDEINKLRAIRRDEVSPSFKGYEEGIRHRLKMDYDNRPKISLWGILKSMIGKDMTKMTLPVSFNEPTSLLQRVAEDLEYTDLLDVAADRTDSLERLVYVAAYAASEYASTIGRVAKPFNPLLGETFEYVRPDKGYRFFVEQVSHHPPIGVALAESPKWDYWGESSLKSKFYGKSFDINLLGTWFLKLRPACGGEELYTWKKVTSSVIGIITGNPTVDNYGLMEIKNWTTGEVCYLDFKPRGWKASSAYQVAGKVVDADGSPKWSIGGRWNDKIYARHTPGYEAPVSGQDPESAKTILVWQAHPRPTGIPFNLTPFVITLNALTDSLRPHLPPTDTRLRPDQRAMEEGEYDLAATEKHRVEEKQRAKRRERETNGEEYRPKWFSKAQCAVTGEEYWAHTGDYWGCREKTDWSKSEDIF